MAIHTMPFLSRHYIGTWVPVAAGGTTHYLTATQEGFSIDHSPNSEDVITDELGAVPIDAINQGSTLTIKTTLQRYDEAFWHGADTDSIRGGGSHTYSAKEAGLFWGEDHGLPGGFGTIGTPLSIYAGVLTLAPYTSAGTDSSVYQHTMKIPLAVPVKGSYQLNTKLAKWEITFKTYPYWDSVLGIWRLFYFEGGVIS